MYYLYWLWVILIIVACWKIYVKAGQPGWKSLIPIYNIYIMLKIVGMSPWYLLALLIPIVNIIVSIIVSLNLAKVFGKSGVYGFFMLWLFSFIGMPLLAFSDAKYQPVSAAKPALAPETKPENPPATT